MLFITIIQLYHGTSFPFGTANIANLFSKRTMGLSTIAIWTLRGASFSRPIMIRSIQ